MSEKKKGILIGIGITTAITAGLVGCQVYVINNVPYTYRTSGIPTLVDYFLDRKGSFYSEHLRKYWADCCVNP